MTPSTNVPSIHELIDLLDQQRGLYFQLQRLSEQQGQMIAGGQPDVSCLVLLLGQRQNLIDQLQRLHGQVEPYRQRWSQLWQTLDPSLRVRVCGLITDIGHLLQTIVARDEQDRGRLTTTPPHETPHRPAAKARYSEHN